MRYVKLTRADEARPFVSLLIRPVKGVCEHQSTLRVTQTSPSYVYQFHSSGLSKARTVRLYKDQLGQGQTGNRELTSSSPPSSPAGIRIFVNCTSISSTTNVYPENLNARIPTYVSRAGNLDIRDFVVDNFDEVCPGDRTLRYHPSPIPLIQAITNHNHISSAFNP